MKRCAVVLLAVLAAPSVVLALDPGVRIRDGFNDIDVNYLPVPCVMDFNCDGKKDLLLGEAITAGTDYGKVRFYPNTNADANPMFNGWSYVQYVTIGGGFDIYLEGSS
jgi:hypothetical protein